MKNIREGERHYGAYRQFIKQTDGQLKRSVLSFEKNAMEHRNKIETPDKYVPNWTQLTEVHKKSLVRKWKIEIENFEEQIRIAYAVIEGRKLTDG
jgi:hypothetical protein